MKIDGQCHCGAISWKAELDLQSVYICHCSDCQTLSGSAFRTIAFVDPDKYSISGKPKIYIKTAESGNRRIQAFCADCGTPFYSTNADGEPTNYSLRLGTCNQRADIKPVLQSWYRSSLKWLNEMGNIPVREKGL